MPLHIGDPVVRTDGRTEGRSRDYYVTTKMSWLDRLPGGSDKLASSAGLRCLAIVTSRREKRARLPSLQKWRWQTMLEFGLQTYFLCY